jgi:hypothetical protein
MLSHRSYNHRIRGPSASYPLFPPHITAQWLLGENLPRLWELAFGEDRPGRDMALHWSTGRRIREKPPEQICRHLLRHVALSVRLEPFYLIHDIHGSDWIPIAVCQTYLHLLCPTFFFLDKLGTKNSPTLTIALAVTLEQP